MRIVYRPLEAQDASAAPKDDGDTKRRPKRVPKEIEVAARMAAPPYSQNATPGLGIGFGS